MRLIAAAVPLLVATAAYAQEGKSAFQRCSNCHATPDLSIRADRLWVEMINESA